MNNRPSDTEISERDRVRAGGGRKDNKGKNPRARNTTTGEKNGNAYTIVGQVSEGKMTLLPQEERR